MGRAYAAAVLCLSASLLVAVPAVGQSVVAGPTSTQFVAAVGDRVTLPVAADMTASGGQLLGAYRMRVKWNPALLRFAGTQGGTFGTAVVNSDSAAQGILKFAGVNASGVGGVTVLASAMLDVLSLGAADTLRVTFQELTAAATFQDLLPILATTGSQFCGGGSFGDLNGDGVVQALDAQIVAMNAVGLSVPDTTRGDVDNDHKVNSRDALVILSQVVGLNVAGFRVGQFLIGACTPGTPSSLAILPGNLTLATGDIFHASANVLSAGGALLNATHFIWSSSSPAVATIDSTGAIAALSNGTTTLSATVAPGVTGSATVTVGPRHRWVVNPALATDKDKEVGSDLFPFSTIAAAMTRAQDGDTVAVGIATYAEPLTTLKHLVFLGDSTAAGMPTISTPGQAAAVLSVVGTQVVRRFRLMNSSGGLQVQADTVDVSSLTIGAVTDVGLLVTHADHAVVRGVRVAGAATAGMFFDGVRTVQVSQASIGGVQQPDSTFGGWGIFSNADTILVDSSSVAGVGSIGLEFALATFVQLRAVTVTDCAFAAVVGDSVRTLTADSLVVARSAEGVFMAISDTLIVRHAHFADLGEAVFGDEVLARLDVSDMTGTRLGAGIDVFPTTDPGTRTALIRRVALSHMEVGIAVASDTVVMDSVTVDDTGGPSLFVDRPAVFVVNGARLTHAQDNAVGTFRRPGFVSITGAFVGSAGGRFGADGLSLDADSILLVSDTIRGVTGRGIAVGEPTRWLRVRDSRFSNIDFEAIAADSVPLVEIVRSEVDSAMRFTNTVSEFQHAVFIRGADSVRMDTTVVQANVGGAVALDSVRVFTQDGGGVGSSGFSVVVCFDCEGGGVFIVPAMTLSRVHRSVLRHMSVFDNRGAGVFAEMGDVADTVVVDGNAFRGPQDLFVQRGLGNTQFGRVELRNNSFSGGADPSFLGSTASVLLGPASSIVFESNTVDSASRGLIALTADSIRVQSNTLTRVRSSGVSVSGATLQSILGNSVACADLSTTTAGLSLNGPGVVSGNTVQSCRNGISVGDNNALNTITVSDNVIDRAGAVNAPNFAINGSGNLGLLRIAHNTITGSGVFVTGFGSLVQLEVDFNSIAGAPGFGISESAVGNVFIRYNSVTGTTATGDLGSAGISLFSVNDTAFVAANTVSGGVGVEGIRLADGVHVVIDTNLVVDNGAAGIVLTSSSPAVGRFNSVRRNAVYGVVDSGGIGGSSFVSNNIESNNIGVGNVGGGATFVATGNWWGDALGPSCGAGATTCNPSSSGNAITASVDASSPASASIGAAPLGAPRFGAVAAAPRFTKTTRSMRVVRPPVPAAPPTAPIAPTFVVRRPGAPAARPSARPRTAWPAVGTVRTVKRPPASVRRTR